jgi:hypothetical protein
MRRRHMPRQPGPQARRGRRSMMVAVLLLLLVLVLLLLLLLRGRWHRQRRWKHQLDVSCQCCHRRRRPTLLGAKGAYIPAHCCWWWWFEGAGGSCELIGCRGCAVTVRRRRRRDMPPPHCRTRARCEAQSLPPLSISRVAQEWTQALATCRRDWPAVWGRQGRAARASPQSLRGLSTPPPQTTEVLAHARTPNQAAVCAAHSAPDSQVVQ